MCIYVFKFSMFKLMVFIFLYWFFFSMMIWYGLYYCYDVRIENWWWIWCVYLYLNSIFMLLVLKFFELLKLVNMLDEGACVVIEYEGIEVDFDVFVLVWIVLRMIWRCVIWYVKYICWPNFVYINNLMVLLWKWYMMM